MKYLRGFLDWYEDNYENVAILIIAGGARDGDEPSEADSVHQYLLRKSWRFKSFVDKTLDDKSQSTPAIIRRSREIISIFPEVAEVIHFCDSCRRFKVAYILRREYRNWLKYKVVSFYRKDITYKSSYWFQFLQTLAYILRPRLYYQDLYKEFKKPSDS